MSSSAPNRRLPGEEPALFRVAAGGSTRARSSIDRLAQPNGGGRTGFAQGRSALGLFEGRRHVAPTLGQWHGSGAQGQAALRMRPRTPFPVARATPSPPLELPLARAALTQPHPSSRIIACLLARFALASDALSPRSPETLLLLTPLGLGAVPASKTICGFGFSRVAVRAMRTCLFSPRAHTPAVAVRMKRALRAPVVFFRFSRREITSLFLARTSLSGHREQGS